MTTWQSFGVTLLLLLGHTLIRSLIHKSLLALAHTRQVSENRVLYVEHVFHFLLGCATLLILAGVWGLDFSRLVVLASSFFAVLGVAMVAQWSILSNITASTAKKEEASTTSREKSSPHTPASTNKVAQPSRKWNTWAT